MIKKPWNHEGELSYIESFKWLLIIATFVVAFSAFFNQSASLDTYPPLFSSVMLIVFMLHISLLNIAMLKDILSLLNLSIIELIKQPIILKRLNQLITHFNGLKERFVHEVIYLKLGVFRI